MMQQDIREAIEKNLSQEVSFALQEVLKIGEVNAEAVIRLEAENKRLKAEEWSRNKMQDTATEQESKEVELQGRETLLAVSEGKHAVRVELFNEFKSQLNLMWAQCFSSPEGKKLAFDLFGSMPMSDNNGYIGSQPANLSGTITSGE